MFKQERPFDRISAGAYSKGMNKALTVLLSFFLCTGCSVQAEEENIRILEVTDIHYLSSSLYDNGSAFQSLMENGDGKLTERGDEIVDALLSEAEKADALILSGDLTFNGEYQSLSDLKKKLLALQDKGIPVLVLPGNHDISYSYAMSYIGDTCTQTENISQKQFKDMMSCFGYDDALYREKNSFSYCYALRKNLWILCLDANTEEAPGTLTEDEISFAEDVLRKADRKGAQVIAVAHQNFLPQSGLLSSGFVIRNHADIASLLEKYNVTLSLSGHSHLQHQTGENSLTDICTESLSVSPLQYGVVQINAHGWSYHNRSLGIYEKEAEERFSAVMEKQLKKSLRDSNVPTSIQESMIAYGKQLNSTYFAGHDVTDLLEDERLSLWEKYGSDTFWYQYLMSMKKTEN